MVERVLNIKDGQRFVRANFTNRGLSKIFNSDDSLSDDTPDKDTVFLVSHVLSDLKIQKEKATGFKTTVDFLGIDYAGYIIEKERLDKDTGSWVRIDEYKIIGSQAQSFKDTRVAYGQVYRYRIKSILKFSTKETKEIIIPASENITITENKKKAVVLDKYKTVLQNVANVANLGLSSKLSTGKQPITIALSQDTDVKIDASNIAIVKKQVYGAFDGLSDVQKLSDPKLTSFQLQSILNKRVATPQKVVEYVSYYYESDPSKNWIYADITETEPPPPPATIKIVPSSTEKKISIYWLKPGNSQRDISKYKIYKRTALGRPWRLLATLPENTNVFTDRNVVVGEKYIYTLASVDVHDIESFLSTQIQAELNPAFLVEKEERKLKWISGSGAQVSEVDLVVKKFYHKREQIIAKQNIVLSPNTKFDEAAKILLIKITSLDSHDKAEIKVTLKNVNTKGSE